MNTFQLGCMLSSLFCIILPTVKLGNLGKLRNVAFKPANGPVQSIRRGPVWGATDPSNVKHSGPVERRQWVPESGPPLGYSYATIDPA